MSKVRVSFDFDDTICGKGDHVPHVWQILFNHLHHGDEVIILTARHPEHDTEAWRIANNPERIAVKEHLDALGIDLEVVYTSHEPKGPHAARLGVRMHYDNDPAEIDSCREHGILAVPVGNEHAPADLPD